MQEANRLGALAELAAEVADRLHVRHLQNLTTSELFAVAAPARTRVLVQAVTTLQAETAKTPLPEGAGTVAFTRFVRPLGPVGGDALGHGRVLGRRPTGGDVGDRLLPPGHQGLGHGGLTAAGTAEYEDDHRRMEGRSPRPGP